MLPAYCDSSNFRNVFSPGPGVPQDAGISVEAVRTFAGKLPIFGVCLGHQALAESFGARLKNMDQVLHGVATPIIQTKPSAPARIMYSQRLRPRSMCRPAISNSHNFSGIDKSGPRITASGY
ncbi:MAG: hypothetical protein P8Z75_00460 [Gammaproteobacteria bacterium]